MGTFTGFGPLFLAVVLAFGHANSGYIVTTPRRWTTNAQSQVCVSLDTGTFASGDFVRYELKELQKEGVVQAQKDLTLPQGESTICATVDVPYTDERHVTLNLDGSLGGDAFMDSVNLTFVAEARRTFIQTDKYLYKPGHKVQIRILSVNGPNLNVVTDNYEEVYLNNPSRTRIAQWLNVSNAAGLVHLDFDLFDEIEEGTYTVGVKLPDKRSEEKSFRVEDYVLPRYEVTIEAPKNILGSDTSVTLTLCARYTFGEPVNGNATLSLSAGSWKVYANLTENRLISGCENFTFPTDQLLFDENNCHIRISNLKANAVVVEDGTDVELLGSNGYIQVHRRAIQFRDESDAWVKKPYLPNSVKISTRFPDNKPATQETIEVCTYYNDENVCKNFTTCNKGFLTFVMPSQIDTRVEMRAVNYPKIERNWNNVMEESRHYKYSYNSEQYVDPTNSSLTIFVPEKLNCVTGERVQFSLPIIYVAKDQSTVNLHVQVISRGQVLTLEKTTVNLVNNELPFKAEEQLLPLEAVPEGVVRGIYEIPMDLPPTVSPKINILVWYSTSDGTVVADAKEVEVSECLPHKVDFSFSAAKAEPGQQTNLVLKGANEALCSIGVVDKSVELLSSDNNKLDIQTILQVAYNSDVVQWDLNQLNLQYCLEKYGENATGTSSTDTLTPIRSSISAGDISYNPYSMLEAIHMFNNAGYYVISNLVLEKLFCDDLIIKHLKQSFHGIDKLDEKVLFEDDVQPQELSIIGGSVGGFGGGSGGGIAQGAAGFAAAPPSSVSAQSDGFPSHKEGVVEETRERSYLPETWLWLLKPLSVTGELEETVTVPDTITEWVGSAVCVHPTEGVGISSKASIITFTPFFVDLTLPSTATRGEILPIKISIFNYLDEQLPVKVFVEPSEDFEFVEGETGVREICVPSKIKSVQTIKVLLSKIADVNITVEAGTHPSLEGCGAGTPPTKKDRFVRSLPVEPEGYLREKTFTKYICTEDFENTEGLADTWVIEAPTDIVEGSARSWVTAMGDLMGPTVENINHLVRLPSGCGEQNMVKFAPNIFVLQYLVASNQDTEFLRSKLTKVLNHGYQRQLLFRHSVDGSFSAFGEKDKEGSTWLTAFVVKSLAQAKPFTLIDAESLNESAEWLKGLQNAEGCYESRGRVINKMLQGGIRGSEGSSALLTAYVLGALLEHGNLTEAEINSGVKCIETDTSVHPYSLALKAYSLVLAKAPSAKTVIDQLLAAAVSNSSDMRWSLPDRKGEDTSLHVETAAYALLALIKFDYPTYAVDARKIVRWISGLRNGQGGFISTQDTVVALQALAAFEEVQPSKNLNMVITGTGSDINHAFTVTEDNKFLQQRIDVPTLPSTIALSVTGEGCSLVQGVLRYNVLADSASDAFSLSVATKGVNSCKTHNIKACASYTLPDGASNMAIIEVKLVSGYIPVKEDLKRVVGDGKGNIKRYEVDVPKVFFYLDEITADESCVEFGVFQEVEIEGAKPGSVSVYDYYQPEFISTQKYTLDAQNCAL